MCHSPGSRCYFKNNLLIYADLVQGAIIDKRSLEFLRGASVGDTPRTNLPIEFFGAVNTDA